MMTQISFFRETKIVRRKKLWRHEEEHFVIEIENDPLRDSDIVATTVFVIFPENKTFHQLAVLFSCYRSLHLYYPFE